MEKEIAIEDICPYLTMEYNPDEDKYLFVCEKSGKIIEINNCFAVK